MILASSPNGSPISATFPRWLSFTAISVGGLAVLLILASWDIISYPGGSAINGYIYDVDSLKGLMLQNETRIGKQNEDDTKFFEEETSALADHKESPGRSWDGFKSESGLDKDSSSYSEVTVDATSAERGNKTSDLSTVLLVPESSPGEEREANITSAISVIPEESKLEISDPIGNKTAATSFINQGCDLYKGSWFYDPLGPIYTNNSCPVLSQAQNCQGNGRPDQEYENWRWKPSECELPRFDGKKFLELMRGKTIAFIGDSVARNQMESMLCLLWQVEVPKNRGNKRMQRYYFPSTSTMLVRIWSSWLVRKSSEPIGFAPDGITKLHLDAPDDDFMEYITTFDVIVISSGHWFAKQSVYVLNNEVVGGQLWWPDKSKEMKINNIEAFGISVETALTSIVTHSNFSGLTIVRSYSPDHYENGAWNTGGSCTGKSKPLAEGELVENGFTDIMHEKQATGFSRASKKHSNKSKLKFMDITEVFSYRHDGHPGPYRSTDPRKLTKRGPDGKPPPQDCLHWCMPGPVDTWNEFVLEIIRTEFEAQTTPPHLKP